MSSIGKKLYGAEANGPESDAMDAERFHHAMRASHARTLGMSDADKEKHEAFLSKVHAAASDRFGVDTMESVAKGGGLVPMHP